jgi:zinc transport system substrate-binding protein
MRTRIILISAIALVLVGVVGLSAAGSGDGRGEGPDVVAGFYPLAFAAEQLGEPDLEVDNLTPPGAEPHDIEVSANDVQNLQAAKLVLLMGRGFQPQLEEAADGADGDVLELLDAPGLGLRPSDDSGEGTNDPHVWLDPLRYAQLVERIAVALGTPNTVGPLVAKLRALDREFRAGLADCARREIVTSHEAFGYLAQRYGLRQVGILGLAPEGEPTPGELTRVIDEVRRSGATTVFSEALLSPELAETVARETGARTAVLNPIEGLTQEQQDRGEDYFSLMRKNLTELRAGLGCR